MRINDIICSFNSHVVGSSLYTLLKGIPFKPGAMFGPKGTWLSGFLIIVKISYELAQIPRAIAVSNSSQGAIENPGRWRRGGSARQLVER